MRIMKTFFQSALLWYAEHVSLTFYVRRQFRRFYGYDLNIHNPQTHSERVFRRKAYFTPEMGMLSDKVAVRDWVKDRIGERYLIPVHAIMDRLCLDAYNRLPEAFVIKANHGSGYNMIVRNKSDVSYEDLRSVTDEWLNDKYYRHHQEFHYRGIKPRLIVEELLLDQDGCVPNDYKCNYFDNNGEPVIYINVMSGRFSDLRLDVFDEEWKHQDIALNQKQSDNPQEIKQPAMLAEMIECTKKLAYEYAYVRVDFFEFDGRLYFGEMTFTPSAGRNNFGSAHVEKAWGALWGTQRVQ